MSKEFVVRLYYSGYITKIVSSNNEEWALLKARNDYGNMEEILPTLKRWEEADEVEKYGEN